MQEKLKFNPVITRIKLNPEQAVLACSCFSNRISFVTTGTRARNVSMCTRGVTLRRTWCSRSFATIAASVASS